MMRSLRECLLRLRAWLCRGTPYRNMWRGRGAALHGLQQAVAFPQALFLPSFLHGSLAPTTWLVNPHGTNSLSAPALNSLIPFIVLVFDRCRLLCTAAAHGAAAPSTNQRNMCQRSESITL
jgi:hypothetical protein